MFEYVQNAGLKFNGVLSKRSATTTVVIHHLAGWGDVKSVNDQEIATNGWIAIGYNVYVRQDGSIWWGRGIDKIGAHCGRTVTSNPVAWLLGAKNNSESIGVGFEGYYHPRVDSRGNELRNDEIMPQSQFEAGVKLIKGILEEFPTVKTIKKHKDMYATNTACPGDYFPFEEMIEAVYKVDKVVVPTPVPAPTSSPSSGNVKSTHSTLRYTKPNMNGSEVLLLQNALIKNGIKVGTDGYFGPQTQNAVRTFQINKELYVDGIVGPKTWSALGV